MTTLLKETLDLAPDGVLYIKFGPQDVLSWPTLLERSFCWSVGDIFHYFL
jgi:hypothetical protein